VRAPRVIPIRKDRGEQSRDLRQDALGDRVADAIPALEVGEDRGRPDSDPTRHLVEAEAVHAVPVDQLLGDIQDLVPGGALVVLLLTLRHVVG
jgi:hypothetical protein